MVTYKRLGLRMYRSEQQGQKGWNAEQRNGSHIGFGMGNKGTAFAQILARWAENGVVKFEKGQWVWSN